MNDHNVKKFLLFLVTCGYYAKASKVELSASSPIADDYLKSDLYVSSTIRPLIKGSLTHLAYSPIQAQLSIDHADEYPQAEYDQTAFYKDEEELLPYDGVTPKSYASVSQSSYPVYPNGKFYPSDTYAENKLIYPQQKAVVAVHEKEYLIPSSAPAIPSYPIYQKSPAPIVTKYVTVDSSSVLKPATAAFSASPYKLLPDIAGDGELYRYETYSPTYKYGAYYSSSSPSVKPVVINSGAATGPAYYEQPSVKYGSPAAVLPEISYPLASSYIQKTISTPINVLQYASAPTYSKYYKTSYISSPSSSIYSDSVEPKLIYSKIPAYNDK